MTFRRTLALSSTLLLAMAAPSGAAVYLLDLGSGSQTHLSPSPPFNNLANPNGSLTGISDNLGSASGINVVFATFNAVNENGTQAPTGAAGAIFPATATRDSFYGNARLVWNNIQPRPSSTVVFSNLDPSGATGYTFDFFASRAEGVTDNRETEYAVDGLITQSVFLNAANNVSEIATVSGMIPNTDGTITVTVDMGPNNNNPQGFYYLGAIRLTTAPVPEPSAALFLSVIGTGVLARRRRSRK